MREFVPTYRAILGGSKYVEFFQFSGRDEDYRHACSGVSVVQALFKLATRTGLGNVRVAKLPDDSRHRVQDEARQILLDQVVAWLNTFLCGHWKVPRSISLTV